MGRIAWQALIVGLAGLSVEKLVKHIPLKVLAGGTIGLVLGLFIAKLIGVGFASIQNTTVNVVIYIILSCIFGYIGMVLGSIKIEELRFPNWSWLVRGHARKSTDQDSRYERNHRWTNRRHCGDRLSWGCAGDSRVRAARTSTHCGQSGSLQEECGAGEGSTSSSAFSRRNSLRFGSTDRTSKISTRLMPSLWPLR